MAGERKYHLERTSEWGTMAIIAMCGVWEVLSGDDRDDILREQRGSRRHNASNSDVV
jgi:hypothetical protein